MIGAVQWSIVIYRRRGTKVLATSATIFNNHNMNVEEMFDGKEEIVPYSRRNQTVQSNCSSEQKAGGCSWPDSARGDSMTSSARPMENEESRATHSSAGPDGGICSSFSSPTLLFSISSGYSYPLAGNRILTFAVVYISPACRSSDTPALDFQIFARRHSCGKPISLCCVHILAVSPGSPLVIFDCFDA